MTPSRFATRCVRAIDEARGKGATVYGIVGKDGGYTKQVADECVVIPIISTDRITPTPRGWPPWCGTCWFRIPR